MDKKKLHARIIEMKEKQKFTISETAHYLHIPEKYVVDVLKAEKIKKSVKKKTEYNQRIINEETGNQLNFGFGDF